MNSSKRVRAFQIELEFGSVIFEERGKPEYPEKNLSEQGREPTTNSTHIWRRRRDLNPDHIGGRRALSPLHHPCSPSRYYGQFSLSLGKVNPRIFSKFNPLDTGTFYGPSVSRNYEVWLLVLVKITDLPVRVRLTRQFGTVLVISLYFLVHHFAQRILSLFML